MGRQSRWDGISGEQADTRWPVHRCPACL